MTDIKLPAPKFLYDEEMGELHDPGDYAPSDCAALYTADQVREAVRLNAQAEFDALAAELESYKRDAIRFRFANDSEEDFAICYWHEYDDGGDWWYDGPKGDAIALLDRAIADAAMKGE